MTRQALLKKRHNRLKRRLALGMDKPGDIDKLLRLKQELGYPLPKQSTDVAVQLAKL